MPASPAAPPPTVQDARLDEERSVPEALALPPVLSANASQDVPAEALQEALLWDDSDDEEDEYSNRPYELRKYIRTLSTRARGYFDKVESEKFGYQHQETPKPPPPKEPPPPPASAASFLYESMRTNSHHELLSIAPGHSFKQLWSSQSAGKLAFSKPFDTQMTHSFSSLPRWRDDDTRGDAMLLGPGQYTGPAVNPRNPRAISLKGKWSDLSFDETRALGPGRYDPPISGTQRSIGVYATHSASPMFANAVGGSTFYRKDADTPGVGAYEARLLPGVHKQPGRNGTCFGTAPHSSDDGRKTGVIGATGASTPGPVGPGRYNPKHLDDRHPPSAFLAGRPHAQREMSSSLGPGSHNIPDNPPMAKQSIKYSFAAQPYLQPVVEPEKKAQALVRAKQTRELASFELTKAGQRQREQQRNESFRVRDERIVSAAKVRVANLEEIESHRRWVEEKDAVREEQKAARLLHIRRQIFWANMIKLGAITAHLGQRLKAGREFRANRRRRFWSACKIILWWRRCLANSVTRQHRLELLSRARIRGKLHQYLQRVRARQRHNSADVLHRFVVASAEAGLLRRTIKEAMHRVRVVQRIWRRHLARRAAYLEIAIMQWNWFEPGRIRKIEKRIKTAEMNANMGVKFETPQGAKPNSEAPPKGSPNSHNDAASSKVSPNSRKESPTRGSPKTPSPKASASGVGKADSGAGARKSGRLAIGVGNSSSSAMSFGGDGAPRVTTPRLTTPRLDHVVGGDDDTPIKALKKRDTANTPKLVRVHPLKNQIKGALVLAQPIKRLKMLMLIRELERTHRQRWNRYRADVETVMEDLNKQVEKKETVAAARQLLLDLPIAKVISEQEIKEKLLKATGPPPVKTPWLPESKLCSLIDEALQTHHFSKVAAMPKVAPTIDVLAKEQLVDMEWE